MNRRDLFKLGALGAISTIVFKTLPAMAKEALHDAGVKKQKYMHDVTAAMKDPAMKAKLLKLRPWKKHLKAVAKDPKAIAPNCLNCQYYKKADAKHKGYGVCAMVQATGKKPGKFAYSNGICNTHKFLKKKKA